VRRNLFWLSHEQWKSDRPHLPTDVRGVERADDRRVISGIVHMLKSGCRWCDCPPEYGPPTTIYNRFVRWARRGVWENLFRELAGNGRATDTQMIDSTHVKAHRSAAGGKGGQQKQAVGRPRGGRNTKFHALADAKGRLLAILLTGGEAHDCPVAERLRRRARRTLQPVPALREHPAVDGVGKPPEAVVRTLGVQFYTDSVQSMSAGSF
jgi:transposase